MADLRAEFLKRTTADWAVDLSAAGVIHSPIQDYGDYLNNEQSKAVDSYSWINHDGLGRIPLPRIPGFDGFVDGDKMAHCPHIGEHSKEILSDLGATDKDIEALINSGAVMAR